MNATLQEIARLIKSARLAKGITQIELAEQAKVSLRSVQRIENAAVSARAHTLRVLAETLNVELPQSAFTPEPKTPIAMELIEEPSDRRSQKLFQAVILGICILLFGMAFLTQAPTFPETTFEMLIFWAFIFGFYLLILNRIFTR